jgi:hypothetical protein
MSITGVQWASSSVSCPAGATTSIPMTVTLMVDNPLSKSLTITTVSALWIDGVPSPDPAWCGLSNSVQWTPSTTSIPSGETTLTLQATETCGGWPAQTTGQCAQQLEIKLTTGCGTAENISQPITLNL